jgi:uncharacterized sulfatase
MEAADQPRINLEMPTMTMLCCVLALCTADAPADERPNIVLIISDDQAWTDYGFMGHGQVRTPHLDRLAAASRVFPRGYVPASLCCPSLASILTGRYPHQHRIVSNDPPMPADLRGVARYASPQFREGRERMNAIIAAQPTLPRLLAESGYVCLQAGKWWQGHYSRGGFTHGMTRGDESRGGRHGDDGLAIGRQTMQPIYDFIADAQRESKPFFVWYAPMLPHQPHNPPDRLLARYRDQSESPHVTKYWAMIEWFDETCGQLLDYLDDRKLAENTIVVYVADNGWIQSPHAAAYAVRSKQSPYDGGLRTPIMVRWPGRVKPVRSAALASSIDIVPTLLHATGVDLPDGMPGVDLLNDAAVTERDAVFGGCFTHDAIDLDAPAKGLRWRWGVVGDWKLIVPNPAREPTGRIELYNVATDRHETQNLAATDPTRVADLTRRIDAWWPGR